MGVFRRLQVNEMKERAKQFEKKVADFEAELAQVQTAISKLVNREKAVRDQTLVP
jgi:hypothetical protein